jgi:hypothetical protein
MQVKRVEATATRAIAQRARDGALGMKDLMRCLEFWRCQIGVPLPLCCCTRSFGWEIQKQSVLVRARFAKYVLRNVHRRT